ncbi:hypothetical protein JTB14_022795 [Gonioctena quinquepunctata]|nr:hypothetical protein JTB14_022795 [Gonioctena quinquepunctata]
MRGGSQSRKTFVMEPSAPSAVKKAFVNLQTAKQFFRLHIALMERSTGRHPCQIYMGYRMQSESTYYKVPIHLLKSHERFYQIRGLVVKIEINSYLENYFSRGRRYCHSAAQTEDTENPAVHMPSSGRTG